MTDIKHQISEVLRLSSRQLAPVHSLTFSAHSQSFIASSGSNSGDERQINQLAVPELTRASAGLEPEPEAEAGAGLGDADSPEPADNF